MKTRLSICAALLACSGFGLPAQAGISIQLITDFSYPGRVEGTTPSGINNRGDIVGSVIDRHFVTQAFHRFSDGSFGPPFAPENSTHTNGNDINKSGLICGDFVDVNGYHGFFLNQSTFTQFDVPGATATLVNGVNDAGDFAGYYVLNNTPPSQGFASINGAIVSFSVAGEETRASGINGSGQIVGYAGNFSPTVSGFFRDSDGTLTYPIMFPGAKVTYLFGINDEGWIVGQYEDARNEVFHGFFLKLPHTFIRYDYPGAVATGFSGINRQGTICGYYDDGSHINKGFVAQVTRDSTD